MSQGVALRVADTLFAEWLDQVADGLLAGMNAANSVAMARALPKGYTERLIEAFQIGKSWTLAGEELGLFRDRAELSMVSAAEGSGALPGTLRRLAKARRARAEARIRMLKAMIYPVLLLHFAALAFAAPYLMEGPPHGFAVAAGRVLLPFWALVALAWAGTRVWPEAPRMVSGWAPFFASYRKSRDAAVFCESLSTGVRSGLRLGEAWMAALAAADSPRIDRMGTAALAAIESGRPASEGIELARGGLGGRFLQLYRSGEASGTLDVNLEAAAERYQSEAMGRLRVATLVYPGLVMVAVYGYAAYKIVSFYQGYFQGLLEMSGGG